MQTSAYRRFVFSPFGNSHLPILVESIGFNPTQEAIDRPEGYPWYHWIGTVEGEGKLSYGNESFILSTNSGVLLPPGMPHSYRASTSMPWETYYLTFGGNAAGTILSGFSIRDTTYFRWEPDSPIIPLLGSIIRQLEQEPDLFGLETSADTYRFLGLLSKYGQTGSISLARNTEKLVPLLRWMEKHYGNPDIGLPDLADVLEVSPRHLSKLFQGMFGLSPYAYLVHLRMNKAKERLASNPEHTVSSIASETGFRDASHFVATFRKHTGMTPQQFRRLH